MIKILVGGCFDILHFGHISFFKQVKAYGNYLIVALESDENVRRMKGRNRPIHSQTQRKEMLESISSVNKVIALPRMDSDKEYFFFIKKVKPDVIAVTQGDLRIEQKKIQAKSVNAQLVVIPKVHSLSTSQLAKLLDLE